MQAFLDLRFEPECLAHAAPASRCTVPGFHTPFHDPSIGRHRHYRNILGAALDEALENAAEDGRG